MIDGWQQVQLVYCAALVPACEVYGSMNGMQYDTEVSG